MKRSSILFSQELIKEALQLPEDLFIYSAEYEAKTNSIRLFFTGPVTKDTPEGMPTEDNPHGTLF